VSFSLGLTEEQRAFTAEEGGMAAANTEPLDQRMDAPR
jgi:hypothetical protein